MSTDIFLCHSSADKPIVRSVKNLLEEGGISCWLDEAEISWGESLTNKVDQGLRNASYVIVVLSVYFVERNWPERELYSALNLEAASGDVKVLPLLIGTTEDRKSILTHYMLLNDKKYLVWPDDKDVMLNELSGLMGKKTSDVISDASLAHEQRKIYIPKINHKPSDLDRHKFVKEGFRYIRDYFSEGLAQLDASSEFIETDLTDIHASKFLSRVFVNGEKKAKCKIWIGGISDSDQISLSLSDDQIDQDNSFNAWLSVSHDNLTWEVGGFGSESGENLSHEEGARHLWSQFTDILEQG